MPLGHLMVGLMGGLAAVAAALLAGLPLWMAALLYVGVGNLCLAISITLGWLASRGRPGPHRSDGGTARRKAARRAVALRPVHLGH